jgi:hypothetical protein
MDNNAKILSLTALCVLLSLQQAYAGGAVTEMPEIDGDVVIVALCLVGGLIAWLREEIRNNRR